MYCGKFSKKIIAGGNHAKTARYEGCVIERNWGGAVVGTIFSRGEGSAVHGPSLCVNITIVYLYLEKQCSS